MSKELKTLSDFPSHCLFEIFENLQKIRTICQLKLVCQRLNQEVDNYFSLQRSYFREYEEFENEEDYIEAKLVIPLEMILTKCPMLKDLYINGFHFSITDEINNVKDMVYLTKLEIDIVQIKANHAQLEALFKKCPNVTNLTLIQFEEFESSTFNFNCLSDKITELKFRGVTPQTFIDLMNTKTFNLNSLTIDSHQVYREDEVANMLLKVKEKYPELKQFELVLWEIWGPFNVLPKLPSLECLYMYFSEADVTVETVKDMLETMPNLRTLDFSGFGTPTIDELIELCARYCPKLEKLLNLNQSKPNLLTDKGLSFWKNLPHLQTVRDKTFEEWQAFKPGETVNEHEFYQTNPMTFEELIKKD